MTGGYWDTVPGQTTFKHLVSLHEHCSYCWQDMIAEAIETMAFELQ